MVKIRLARVGKKNRPSYRILVADQRFHAQKRFIEIVGFYDPINKLCIFDKDKIAEWQSKGAKLSDRVASIIESGGAFTDKKKTKPNRKSIERAKAAENAKKEEAEAKKAEEQAAQAEETVEEKNEQEDNHEQKQEPAQAENTTEETKDSDQEEEKAEEQAAPAAVEEKKEEEPKEETSEEKKEESEEK